MNREEGLLNSGSSVEGKWEKKRRRKGSFSTREDVVQINYLERGRFRRRRKTGTGRKGGEWPCKKRSLSSQARRVRTAHPRMFQRLRFGNSEKLGREGEREGRRQERGALKKPHRKEEYLFLMKEKYAVTAWEKRKDFPVFARVAIKGKNQQKNEIDRKSRIRKKNKRLRKEDLLK